MSSRFDQTILPSALMPGVEEVFGPEVSGDLTQLNFEGAISQETIAPTLTPEDFAPVTSDYQHSLELSANNRPPITDQQAIQIADKINDSFGIIDYEKQALATLENLSAEEVQRVDQFFIERHARDWEVSGLRELFIDQMSGANLDRGLDLLEGFNPDRLARLVHEVGYSWNWSKADSMLERIDGLTTEQYQELSEAYQAQYGSSLSDYLKGELWGHQVSEVVASVYGKEAVEVAELIHNKLGSAKYSEFAFIVSSLEPEARQLVESAYSERYGTTLSGEYEQLTPEQRQLIDLSQKSSPLAIEVMKIRQAFGYFSMFTDSETLRKLLSGRTQSQMEELKSAYKSVFNEPLLETCRERTSAEEYGKLMEMIMRPGASEIA